MSSKYETGHSKNMANFHTLITYLESQPDYAPDADELKLAALTAFKTEVETASDHLVEVARAMQQIINDRQALFADARDTANRIMNYLESNITDKEAIKDVRTFHNEMKSKPLSRTEIIKDDGTTSEKTYSSNRLSYDSIAEHFHNIVERLKTVPGYAPSDNKIKLATLMTQSEGLLKINKDIASHFVIVTNARDLRNSLMYTDDTGLVDKANRIKKYLKYKFGNKSDQYHFAHNLKYSDKKIRKTDIIDP